MEVLACQFLPTLKSGGTLGTLGVADALSVIAMLVVCGAVCLVGAVLVAPVLVGLSRVGVAGWLLSWGAALWNARSLVASSN